MIYSFRTSSYARDIYLYGNRRFADISPEYQEPVKQYAAVNFTQDQMDNALTQNFISQEEYNQTMAYKTV